MGFIDVVLKPIAEEISPHLNDGRSLALVFEKERQRTFEAAATIRYILMGIIPKHAGDKAYLDKMGKMALELPDEIKRGINRGYKDGIESARNPIPIDANPHGRYAEPFTEDGFFSPSEPSEGA